MDLKRFFKHFISFGSIFYTAISVLFIVIASFAGESGTLLIEPDKFLIILLFAFIMALGSAIIRSPEIPHVGAVCAHAGCFIVGFLIFVVLCGIDFARSFIATVIFAVAYAIVMLIINAIKKAANKKSAPKEPSPKKEKKARTEAYKSQFGK